MGTRKSKLYRLLASLDAAELAALDAYIRVPFLNRSRKAEALYEALRPFFPVPEDTPEAPLPREALFAQVFPDQPYQESKLSNLMTTLSGVVEQFLAWSLWQTDEALQQRMRLRALQNRPGLEDDFVRSWQKAYSRWQKAAVLDPEHGFHTLGLIKDMLTFQASHQARSQENLLPESLQQLRQFVLLLSLKYYLAAINRQRLVSEELDTSFLAYLTAYLEAQPELADTVPLRLYVRLIHCLQVPGDQEAYIRLKAAFATDLDQLADVEAREMTYLLLNYLNGRLKLGENNMLPELLFQYQQALERGLLYQGQSLDGNIYLNILNVVSGVIRQHQDSREREELIDWRKTFLEREKSRLLARVREETFAYAQAYMHYQEGDFGEAYRILSQYKHPDAISDISRRLLLIRVYYDAHDPDLFDAQVKSALMYISRAEAVSEPKRLAYNKFVRLTRRLHALRDQMISTHKVDILAAEIMAPEPLECRQWLREKCQHLLSTAVPDP